jgi:hypothetical protein
MRNRHDEVEDGTGFSGLAPTPDERREERRAKERLAVTDKMVKAALDAWFSGSQSESDMGLERGMRAAIEAALAAQNRH